MEEELMRLVEKFKLLIGELLGINERFSGQLNDLRSRLEASEASLVSAVAEIDRLKSLPIPVPETIVRAEVDLSPVLSKLDALLARPVAVAGAGDQANWDKLWTIAARLMSDSSEFKRFVDGVKSRFGF